jgi:hypothetical protein
MTACEVDKKKRHKPRRFLKIGRYNRSDLAAANLATQPGVLPGTTALRPAATGND